MKAELTHIGVEIPATATFLEIFELHENLVLDKGIDLFEEDIKNVKFPCLPVSSRFQSYTATQTQVVRSRLPIIIPLFNVTFTWFLVSITHIAGIGHRHIY